ncbi:MAG TPA: VanW family protein [Micromonosporaceae bacterium]|jgi:vancomycin resistance protein YoaR|nr:VanW family protein [Micromonosporaceae bacterium]
MRLPPVPTWIRRWAGPRPRPAAALAASVAVLAAAVGVGAAVAYAGDVPRGTTVLGIDLGGKSRAEAARSLRAGLDARQDRVTAPVKVRVGEQATQFEPADIGLAVDVDATVDAAIKAGRNPLAGLFGAYEVDPVVTLDGARLAAALRPVADKAGQTMVMPAIEFEGTTPKAVYPKPGRGVSEAQAADAVAGGWLRTDEIEIPLRDINPVTTAADVDRLLNELARPAVAAPVAVTTPKGQLTVGPAAIAKSLVLTADERGEIKPRVDEDKLRAALAAQLAGLETKPRQARITTAGGRPQILASTGGQLVDTGRLSTDLLAVLPRTTGRTVDAGLVTVQAQTTTEDLAGLGIKEQVSSFTTYFTGGLSSPRSKNIIQIAGEVDGAIVKPGDTFSLNGHTGPRGYAQGYRDAPVILDGKLVPGVGGGASQFTTTIFNAAYYAGLQDVEHKPHSFYFSRYPAVIESTIYYPDLDLKFRNDTPYGVLIDTSYTGDSITVSMWSTKVYDSVRTEWSAKRGVTEPEKIYLDPGPTCIATSGSRGFTQDAWRIFRRDGREIKREKFSWRYDAEPEYVCGKAPKS